MNQEIKFVLGVVMAALMYTGSASAADTPQGPIKCNPPASVTAKAKSPAPPADAKQVKSVGKKQTKVKTNNDANDTDSAWVEELDIDGDGNVEETDVVWDDEDKVLYFYADGTFTCANGGTGEGGLLIAVFAAGNTANQPAGSGWYVVQVDKSECASATAGIFGCQFDANGNATACGAAVVDEKTDTITIATVSE